jgi:predicted acylesterase/phospholipase RssA
MSGLWQPHVISFSSGGVRIIGHLGVLAALTEAGVAAGVREWYGCSGGAICALVGALGVGAAWLRDCAGHFDLRTLGQLTDDPAGALFSQWGLVSGDAMIEMFGRFIDTWETGASAWTFADIARERPHVRLGITAVNVSRGELGIFSSETTPDVRLLDAVRASTAIPMFFMPWRDATGDIWCDGALVEQYPWSAVRDKQRALVVVCSESTIDPGRGGRVVLDGLTDYLEQLIGIGRRRYQLDAFREQPRYWIATNNRSVSSLDLELDMEGRLELFEEGRVAAGRWLAFRATRRLPAALLETDGTPPQSAGPGSAAHDRDGGSRTSGSRPLHREDAPYPFHRPDTGAQRRDRRWSL